MFLTQLLQNLGDRYEYGYGKIEEEQGDKAMSTTTNKKKRKHAKLDIRTSIEDSEYKRWITGAKVSCP